mmetsp:Transcript_25859/g.39650  ORF Transcript_25859/g.39650 Transcript_25859/m.39650 type:complete len:155 (+) Transcript_25859:111-575(+)
MRFSTAFTLFLFASPALCFAPSGISSGQKLTTSILFAESDGSWDQRRARLEALGIKPAAPVSRRGAVSLEGPAPVVEEKTVVAEPVVVVPMDAAFISSCISRIGIIDSVESFEAAIAAVDELEDTIPQEIKDRIDETLKHSNRATIVSHSAVTA